MPSCFPWDQARILSCIEDKWVSGATFPKHHRRFLQRRTTEIPQTDFFSLKRQKSQIRPERPRVGGRGGETGRERGLFPRRDFAPSTVAYFFFRMGIPVRVVSMTL